VRNAERILDAAVDTIADDPAASLEQIATNAGVSRPTLYAHFANRDALMDELTRRSAREVAARIRAARPDEGAAEQALARVVAAAWATIGRYRGLVVINRRLPPEQLRAHTAPAVSLLRGLILRGQREHRFDPELSPDWLLTVLIELIHTAARQVSAGAMDSADAEAALLRTADAVLARRTARRGKH
jgi:TetR/AcrR family transcriptional repressor of mexCD-oprJ operon